MTDKKNCLNTITVNKECQKTPYYKDKATQTAALRVTNNSHFHEASLLKSFCFTFKFPFKATRLQGSFLHTTQCIFKPLVSRTTDPQFMFVLFRCASATNYMSRKHNGSNVNVLQMIDTIRSALLPFSKQEVPKGLQSLKASVEQETETELFCK